jgi:hypothetical protein
MTRSAGFANAATPLALGSGFLETRLQHFEQFRIRVEDFNDRSNRHRCFAVVPVTVSGLTCRPESDQSLCG